VAQKFFTSAMNYQEPELTYLVLDFRKEDETRRCLLSIRLHTKFPHKIIYLHNGADVEYPYTLFQEGLIDQFIQTKKNHGLAIGTRDLFAGSFSPYSLYLQNDQYLKRDFSYEELQKITGLIGAQLRSPEDGSVWKVMSVDLAGGMWGLHGYTERAHIIPTEFYKTLEREGRLGFFGAGPYHRDPWREEQMQRLYKAERYLHYTYEEPLVVDFGHRAIRENADGSLWEHKTDTKELRLLRGPVRERGEYPHFNDAEWRKVLETGEWPEWAVPERDRPHVFREWN
jgi:hypothetical protein